MAWIASEWKIQTRGSRMLGYVDLKFKRTRQAGNIDLHNTNKNADEIMVKYVTFIVVDPQK